MKSSGSKTGSKIKIQSDNAYSAINEVSCYDINFLLKYIYNFKLFQ